MAEKSAASASPTSGLNGSQDAVEDPSRSAAARLAVLAETGLLLSSALDYEEAARGMARLAVPVLGDYCLIDLMQGPLDDPGPLRRVEVAHSDPSKESLLAQMRDHVPGIDADHPVRRVLRSGQAEVIGPLLDQEFTGMALDDEHRRILQGLEPRYSMVVPLLARGHTLGAISFVRTGARPPFGPEDRALADELARRIALAVDNARLYREARESIRVRDEFLSIASHELKTPLTSIQLHLQSLMRSLNRQEEEISLERVAAKVQTAQRQVDRLAQLINNLLDLSRITGGRLDLQMEEFDFARLVREIAARSADELHRMDCTLDLHADGPVRVRSDRMRLDQVITNLLSNAMKYGRGKPVGLSIRVEGPWALVTVRDQGIGIAQEDQQRIFERFERAVSDRHYGGFGLGLWIVRQIVEALGGAIQVESTPNEGSSFTVKLPLVFSGPPQPA